MEKKNIFVSIINPLVQWASHWDRPPVYLVAGSVLRSSPRTGLSFINLPASSLSVVTSSRMTPSFAVSSCEPANMWRLNASSISRCASRSSLRVVMVSCWEFWLPESVAKRSEDAALSCQDSSGRAWPAATRPTRSIGAIPWKMFVRY